MDNNLEQPDPSPSVDSDDLWIRGVVYANQLHALAEAEIEIQRLEKNAARARYEYEIAQRIRDKMEEPEAHKDWDIQASVMHDCMVMAEHELAEAVESADYHRAMAAEIEADLGDEAEVYASLLADFGWGEEDEEDEDFDDLDVICPFIDVCPLMYDEDFDEYEIYEDYENDAADEDVLH
jgi:hypothetical protein